MFQAKPLLATMAAASCLTGTSANLKTCSSSSGFSCQSSSTTPTCCFNYPGGAFLQTQFWDTDPVTGPSNSWTIHGLWPDNCDGTYQSNCDSTRAYTNITEILQAQGRSDLVTYMDKYWVDIDGDNESFWEHEWAKHGTCINTIDPDCYTGYAAQQEVGDFFQKTVDLFKGLDTYKALANAGITPSTTKTYTKAAIQAALAKAHDGAKVYIDCDSGNLNQVWYFFNVQGNIIDGTYDAVDSLTTSGCSSTGIKYVPKS